MTMVESILIGLVISVFTCLVTLVSVGKGKVSVEDLNLHKKDPSPHVACPVHTTQLKNIEEVLSRIDRRVYQLIGSKDDE